ncbi:1,4-dihydroxy-2-naphthoate octaprenyltransferase [Brachymonas chironomi]|uniref:1,4-dihydroxy-2-naphthoate octaprenyltransferase n=1 Tax=Brachymonas chironomi TaxID=491919 RepID=UPI001B7F9E49|nr:1,4-dihydroxy-2-naphthoate octaprenyltransferase [Brachymonas chironomi]
MTQNADSTDAGKPVAAPPSSSPSMAWLLAARPHTLGVTLSGVLAACTLAWHQKGGLDWPVAIVTFLAAILIQIATNLFNDAGDYESGIDRGERLGPDRAVAKGWLGTRQVKQAGLGCLALAFVLGVYLVVVGGWPIVLLGLVALFCGWAYTLGPAPISHGPLGEIFVWVFFGLAAVLGTYYLQTGTLSRQIWILGHMMGAFASAVMLVNNTRDAASDVLAGKYTLAVRIGLPACRLLYAGMLAVPYLLALSQARHWAHVLPHLTLPLAVLLVYRMATWPPSKRYNWLLARTAHLQLAFTVLWVLALILD